MFCVTFENEREGGGRAGHHFVCSNIHMLLTLPGSQLFSAVLCVFAVECTFLL
jgi:hypothetical protein